MSEDKQNAVDYALSQSEGEGSISVSIPIRVAKMLGQALFLLIAGAIGGGSTTLAIRSVNPVSYDRFTGADANDMAKYIADEHRKLNRVLTLRLQTTEAGLEEVDNKLGLMGNTNTSLLSASQECMRNNNRIDARVTRIEQRLWNKRSKADIFMKVEEY